jgi:hypothetical protein
VQCTLAEITERFDYLDKLRESGRVNMFGAAIELMDDLGLSKADARTTLAGWMGSFDGETSVEDRAEAFISENKKVDNT